MGTSPPPATPRSWKPIALLVVAMASAFALRLSIGRGIGHPTDMAHFVERADEAANHPLGEIYSRTASTDPLGAATIRWLVGNARAAWPTLTRPDNRYLSVKLPAIVGDLVTAWLIFLIAARAVGRPRAIGAATFYLFNPAVIANGAHWGQWDGLVPIFPLLALYALQRDAWWVVGPCLAAALAMTVQSVPLAATILAFVLVDTGAVRTCVTVLCGALTFAFVSLPFILAGQLGTMVQAAYAGTVDAAPALRFGALNFWDVLDPAIPDDDYALFTIDGWPITPRLVGFVLFALAWLPPTLAGCARRDTLGRAYALGLVGWVSFMFPTQVHERYLLPAVAFFTATAARGHPLTVAVAAATSLIHLYSCYFRSSWGDQGIVDAMRAGLVLIFVAALHHLRTECLDQPSEEPRGVPPLAALSRSATERIRVSLLVLGGATVGAALLVSGWFHSFTNVALVPLGAYRATPPTRVEVMYDRIPIAVGETKRFRVPPVFATLRGGVEIAGAEGGACVATFAVRADTTEPWMSPPIAAGSGVRPLEVPFAAGSTEIALSVQAPDCPDGTTFEWVSPELVPWRPAAGWDSDDVLSVSDLDVGVRWPLSMLSGEGVWRRDRSVRGDSLWIGGRRFSKGLGVQADSVLSIRVPDGATAFASDVGYVDDAEPQGVSGTLRFIVAIDGREAYRSPEVAAGERIDDVQVPLDGGRRVTLVVESTAPGTSSVAAWGDARFIRERR